MLWIVFNELCNSRKKKFQWKFPKLKFGYFSAVAVAVAAAIDRQSTTIMIIIYRFSMNQWYKQTNKCQLKSFFRCCSFALSLFKSSKKCLANVSIGCLIFFFKFKFQLSPTQQQQQLLNCVCVCVWSSSLQPAWKESIHFRCFFSRQ